MVIDLVVLVHVGELLALDGCVIGRVEEAILEPGSTGELRPFDMVGEKLLGGDVHHIDLHPVGTAALDGVCEILSVVGLRSAAIGHRAVVRQLVGIQQHLRLRVGSVLDIQHALVLQAVVLAVDVTAETFRRDAVTLVVHQVHQAFLDGTAEGDVAKIILRHGTLGIHPRRGLLGGVVLQPTIGIRDEGPKIIVHHAGVFGCLGIGRDLIARLDLLFTSSKCY